ATATIPLTIDDILTGFASTGASLSFTLTRAPIELAFQVLRGTEVVTVPAVPALTVGPQALTWNGLLADGSRAPDGTYTLALTVIDEFTTSTRTVPLTLDATPPKIAVVSYRNLRFRVSEASTLVLVVGKVRFTRVLHKPATTQFWLKVKPASYVLTATDAAGNTSIVRYRR
ncbi:MAG: hypothetical protein QOF43_556, partial [Gaiellaceae bacterium]|nr:hypothetical protein [Gaiellaceae bacterium]